ncbi:MAG: M20/M25/M40 family metallo-hydrolase, partial [Clostridiales bacterium]|nr:M20/M25/M40 family metallo-hydrolase [Clostridiales bacterium]
ENIIISKALDNRTGCYIATKAALTDDLYNDVYFVFTTQEEVGTRGAGPAAYGCDPDVALVLDVTDTGDIPGCPPMDVKMGGGAAIKVKDKSFITHPELKNVLENAAERGGIPFQYEIMEEGGTDGGRIQAVKSGIPVCGISVPVRYIHSQSEMCSKTDLENCYKLTLSFLNGQFS